MAGWRPKGIRIEFLFLFLLMCYSGKENIPSILICFLNLQTLECNLKISWKHVNIIYLKVLGKNPEKKR